MKPFVYGQILKNNKFYVFDKQGVTAMKHWPEILVYRKTAKINGTAIEPKFEFNGYYLANAMSSVRCFRCYENEFFGDDFKHECRPEPLVRFFDNVPRELIHLNKSINNRQSHLLALFAQCGKPAIELFKSTPALAWMLASSWAFKLKPVKNHFRSIRNLLESGKSQIEMLEWLDYPATKGVIKLLRKVYMKRVDVTFFLNLKEVINDCQKLNLIKHLPVIKPSLIRLLCEFKMNFTYHFLVNYQRKTINQQHRLKLLLSDCFPEKYVQWHHKFTNKDLTLFINHIDDYDTDNSHHPIVSENRVFPLPPFNVPDGFQQIEYVDSEDELLKESEEMHNCLHNYVEQCCYGTTQIFRILQPERAVFSVVESSAPKVLELSEIKAVCNKTVCEKTLAYLQTWLNTVNACNDEIKIGLFLSNQEILCTY